MLLSCRTRLLPQLAGVSLAARLIVGCVASGEDACTPLCAEARPAYEACMELWGMDYGDPAGYESPGDYDNWCGTYLEERRLLARSAEDPAASTAALMSTCEEQRDSLAAGDCNDYYGTFGP